MNSEKTQLVVSLSFGKREASIEPSSTLTQADYEKHLVQMTHIFRANFWATFSRVDLYETVNREIEAFGLRACLSDVVVLHSTDSDFDGIEGDDHVISFVLEFNESVEKLNEAKTKCFSELPAIECYSSIMDEGLGYSVSTEFGCREGSIPGVSSHISRTASPGDELSTTATLGGFFHYAWIILLRLERAQMALRISGSSNDIFYSSDDIIQQRVRLINIKRRFLTHDRTNHPNLQKLCTAYRAKFKMDQRFDSLNTIHEFFEHHLDNTSKVIQARRTKALSQALNILTFLAIPLGIIGTILAIDLQSSFLTSPGSVLKNSMLWFLFGSTFGAVVGTIALARFFDVFLNRRK